ncbi:hypothetical protein PR048_027484 [Dryococelus australis]|uniref:Uncharacterized protein n=1 Tax=Dryococelus australis TaxID=614101 RepID=A0ABQ9GFL4_9NEOP|nr:hypothetical protein PR048_027484 [Dryococelus australis]
MRDALFQELETADSRWSGNQENRWASRDWPVTRVTILVVQHLYIGTKIKLYPGSELGSFDIGSGKMLVQPDICLRLSILAFEDNRDQLTARARTEADLLLTLPCDSDDGQKYVQEQRKARLHSPVYTRASAVCSLVAAPESSQCCTTSGSLRLATCFLASLLFSQRRPGLAGNDPLRGPPRAAGRGSAPAVKQASCRAYVALADPQRKGLARRGLRGASSRLLYTSPHRLIKLFHPPHPPSLALLRHPWRITIFSPTPLPLGRTLPQFRPPPDHPSVPLPRRTAKCHFPWTASKVLTLPRAAYTNHHGAGAKWCFPKDGDWNLSENKITARTRSLLCTACFPTYTEQHNRMLRSTINIQRDMDQLRALLPEDTFKRRTSTQHGKRRSKVIDVIPMIISSPSMAVWKSKISRMDNSSPWRTWPWEAEQDDGQGQLKNQKELKKKIVWNNFGKRSNEINGDQGQAGRTRAGEHLGDDLRVQHTANASLPRNSSPRATDTNRTQYLTNPFLSCVCPRIKEPPGMSEFEEILLRFPLTVGPKRVEDGTEVECTCGRKREPPEKTHRPTHVSYMQNGLETFSNRTRLVVAVSRHGPESALSLSRPRHCDVSENALWSSPFVGESAKERDHKESTLWRSLALSDHAPPCKNLSAARETGIQAASLCRSIAKLISSVPRPFPPGRSIARQRAAVAERLDCSPPTKANQVQYLAGSLLDFRVWESCRTMPLVGGFFFYRVSAVSLAPSFQRGSILTSITLMGSQDTASLWAIEVQPNFEIYYLTPTNLPGRDMPRRISSASCGLLRSRVLLPAAGLFGTCPPLQPSSVTSVRARKGARDGREASREQSSTR